MRVKKIRILHVTKKYPNALGGDAIVSFNLEKQQMKLGHEAFILTTNCDEIIDKPNIIKFGLKDLAKNWDIVTFKRLFSSLILFFLLFSLIKKIRPDVVHIHSVDLGFILSFVCKLYKIPIINQCHGVSFPYKQNTSAKRIIEKFCLKYSKFNKIVTVDKNSLPSFKKINIKNVIYMPNGVDLEKFNKKKTNKTNKTIFLFVGRLEKQKGLIYLINAINILKVNNSNFEVHLVGTGTEEAYLKELVSKFNFKKYIKFIGKKTSQETTTYYVNSDVFILPSIWEGFPLTLLEAWAASLPVIITNVGGVSKICTNKKNALIIPSQSPEKIAEAMLSLIKNKKLREKLGKNGRKLVEEKYSWEKVAKKFVSIYKNLIILGYRNLQPRKREGLEKNE